VLCRSFGADFKLINLEAEVTVLSDTATVTWGIAALATTGVILRPWRLPEGVWAVLGALTLVLLGLLPWRDALSGIRNGVDVYFFLIGMMLLAELARREGLFDWLAAVAVDHARGSPQRLFMLVYIVGVLVTVFLSNDARAVVLTPAVYAAARAAGAEPLPYLLICAFIANAASFVLPISNPANLVVFGNQMPPLLSWLGQFALPSILSIGATYVALRLCLRGAIKFEALAPKIERPRLSRGGWLAAAALGATAISLLSCSAVGLQLGLPTFLCGSAATLAIVVIRRQLPWPILKEISWGILPLVAGLFVLVEALAHTGVIAAINRFLSEAIAESPTSATWETSVILAFASNLMNNLPVGLIAGSVIAADHVPQHIAAAALIGVDLGPNLSITGSLATILWLAALRREGQSVEAWRFLRLGAVIMLPALILSIVTLIITPR
jgi:arsenical pump membrane protein